MKSLEFDLIRTFVSVVRFGGFSRAAEQLHKTQSTVSAQIKKLEAIVGQPVLKRDTRSLQVTPQGELLLQEGTRLLAAHDLLLSRMAEPELEGSVRLGTPEDFASSHLHHVLAAFNEAHPRVRLEVTCELTRNLNRQFRAGEHDLVLLKREPEGPSRGTRVWREPLVWVRGRSEVRAVGDEVPLVVSPQPCVYRERAVAALQRSGHAFRIAYQCTSLAGSLAAVRAGLGVTILPRDMVPHGYNVMGVPEDMPDLPDTEIALCIRGRHPTQPVRKLFDYIVHALEST